jgi:hypothetical protein
VSSRQITNVAASVHHRLMSRVRATGVDPNDTLVRYALERFPYHSAVRRANRHVRTRVGDRLIYHLLVPMI